MNFFDILAVGADAPKVEGIVLLYCLWYGDLLISCRLYSTSQVVILRLVFQLKFDSCVMFRAPAFYFQPV